MKKIIYVIILLLTLTGCQKKITTFDEVIENGKVGIDGITYDIQSVREISYEYDDDNNLIRRISTYTNTEHHTEFLYDGDLLIEEKSSYPNLNSTVLYHYNSDGRKSKIEYLYESGSLITEFEYNEENRKIIFKYGEGNISHYNEGVADDQDNMLTLISYDAEGNVTGSVENFYENNQLISTVSEGFEGQLVTHHYEYNNIGDKIFWYAIRHGEEPIMIVRLYEYEYNNDMLPTNVTEYQVQSPISEENIRDYK